MLGRLVAYDTTSALSNLALIEDVREQLAALGVEVRLTHNTAGDKANLWATIGPADRGGIVLSGHTDVVPVAGQDWTSDPFTMVERDGLLYGRGTSDMKAFIAIALAYAGEMVTATRKIRSTALPRRGNRPPGGLRPDPGHRRQPALAARGDRRRTDRNAVDRR